jgi:hypothetical protein
MRLGSCHLAENNDERGTRMRKRQRPLHLRLPYETAPDISLTAPPVPSLTNIVCEGRDAAWKLSSCSDVENNDNDSDGTNDNE